MANVSTGELRLISGTNPDIDTGTEEMVPIVRGTLPTNEFIASIASSDNTNDKAAGTGALTARIFGLAKTSYAEVFEDVILNGTGAVTTTQKFIRINRVEVLTVGTGGANAGALTTSLNAQVQDTVAIARNRSHSAVYATGVGVIHTIQRVEVNASLGYSAVTFEWRDISTLGTPGAWQVTILGGSQSTLEQNRAIYNVDGAISVPAKCEWRVRVTSSVDNNVTSAAVYFTNHK